MKVLITGVAGFIGFHVAKKFIANKIKVIGVDNLNSYYDVGLKKDRIKNIKKVNKNYFKFYHKDINNIFFLKKLFSKNKFEAVIHLAAQPGVRYSFKNPKSYFDNNLNGFVNVLEILRLFKVKHFIFASSSSVYGDSHKARSSEADSCDMPLNLYAATKKSNEILGYSYSKIYNIKMTALRFFTVYGPWGRPDMAYFKFVDSIFKRKKIDIYNHGKHKRDFSYIDQIVDGIFAIFSYRKKNKKPFNIYNLASGRPFKLLDFISMIEKIIGHKSKKNYLNVQKGDILETAANINKFYRDFKIKQKLTLEQGLKEFINWYKNYYNKKI
jgi:UDP-glucuronate 4-epimerase